MNFCGQFETRNNRPDPFKSYKSSTSNNSFLINKDSMIDNRKKFEENWDHIFGKKKTQDES